MAAALVALVEMVGTQCMSAVGFDLGAFHKLTYSIRALADLRTGIVQRKM